MLFSITIRTNLAAIPSKQIIDNFWSLPPLSEAPLQQQPVSQLEVGLISFGNWQESEIKWRFRAQTETIFPDAADVGEMLTLTLPLSIWIHQTCLILSGLLCLSLMDNGLSKQTPEDIWQDARAVLHRPLPTWPLFTQLIPQLMLGQLGRWPPPDYPSSIIHH
jgi:hypothetical protein